MAKKTMTKLSRSPRWPSVRPWCHWAAAPAMATTKTRSKNSSSGVATRCVSCGSRGCIRRWRGTTLAWLTCSILPAAAATCAVPASEGQLGPDHADEPLGHGSGLVAVGGLDHDADDRLGAGLAQQDAPGLPELALGLAHGIGNGGVGLQRGLVDALDVDEHLREVGHDAGEVGEGATRGGDPRGQHEPGERAVTGRAVVEHDDVSRLLPAEGVAPALHPLEDVAVTHGCLQHRDAGAPEGLDHAEV